MRLIHNGKDTQNVIYREYALKNAGYPSQLGKTNRIIFIIILTLIEYTIITTLKLESKTAL